jgi:hypothetical protein
MMLDDMVQVYNIDLASADVRFIKALIAGDPNRVSCVYGYLVAVSFLTYLQRKAVLVRDRCE